MDRDKILRGFENDQSITSLMKGSPGPQPLKKCKDLLLKATNYMLDKEADTTHMFVYGPDQGDSGFREELAQFLTEQYGDFVCGSNLMVTAGATQALHMIASVLLNKHSTVFIEDPTYYAACRILQKDLGNVLVPVARDADGIDTDVLDQLLTKYCPVDFKTSAARPFWGMVYMIPVFNNPTGHSYSSDRCRRLVELARKHDVLLLAEDIYNLIHFGESVPPARLLSYDNVSDPDYSGHVLSSGSFSKILAPSLRLGWIEAPDRILSLLCGSNILWSGGSLNHYVSKLAGATMKLGLETQHLIDIRRIYKERNDAVCEVLATNLPEGTAFQKPKGGFFVWIEFPKETDTFEMMQWMIAKYNILFLPGVCSSVLHGRFQNCARISISYYEEQVLVEVVRTFCKGATEYIQLNKGNADTKTSS